MPACGSESTSVGSFYIWFTSLVLCYNGGIFGDDPDVLYTMRQRIQENRRLLYEMNYEWHEDENEIIEIFKHITAKSVGDELCHSPDEYMSAKRE